MRECVRACLYLFVRSNDLRNVKRDQKQLLCLFPQTQAERNYKVIHADIETDEYTERNGAELFRHFRSAALLL